MTKALLFSGAMVALGLLAWWIIRRPAAGPELGSGDAGGGGGGSSRSNRIFGGIRSGVDVAEQIAGALGDKGAK